MGRIIEHIECLLLQHDCVIIPDFGGFVLQTIPAEYNEESHLFTPAHKEIVFNPTLTHNDGLLMESYMNRYSSDYAIAQTLVKRDVIELKERLEGHSELRLGSIGLFFKEEDRLIFMPAKHSDELFSVQSFGLPVFSFLPLTAHNHQTISSILEPWSDQKAEVGNEKTPARRSNVIYSIPVTRTFLRIAVASAAAILLFLFLATPVSDVNKASYTASFVPQEIMPKKTADEIVTDAFSLYKDEINPATTTNQTGISSPDHADLSTATASLPSSTGSSSTPATTSPVTTPPSSPPPAAASPKTTPAPSSKATSAKPSAAPTKATTATTAGTRYYVIIGSFKTRGQAQGFISRMKGIDKTNTGILVRDGRVRVYSQICSTEKEAQSLITKLRQNPSYKDTWLYSGP